MMPKTATFCSPSLLDTQELCRVMARVIALDRTECADSYRHLNDAFSRVSRAPFQDDFVRKPRALIQAAIASPGDYPGIDFPCWLEPEGGRRVTVMLVGQDPVRDATYFTVPATEPYVVIGTPYSVHSQALRSWRNNPRYWMLIQHLLDAGYMLYLSDIAKAWPSAEGGTAERIAREILEYEIALVAPTLVVTGEPSLDHVVSAEGTSEYLHLIHHACAVRLEQTGHLGYITRPREFAATVREFLASRAAGESGLSTGTSRGLSSDRRLSASKNDAA